MPSLLCLTHPGVEVSTLHVAGCRPLQSRGVCCEWNFSQLRSGCALSPRALLALIANKCDLGDADSLYELWSPGEASPFTLEAKRVLFDLVSILDSTTAHTLAGGAKMLCCQRQDQPGNLKTELV